MSQQVIIFDTTLRDGEQALQASLNVKEKMQIALALERMGVDVMEVGFPVSSPVTLNPYRLSLARLRTVASALWPAVWIKILTSPPKRCASLKPSAFTYFWRPLRCTLNPS